MRYMKCARFFEEQNIVSQQEGTEIYYRVIKVGSGVALNAYAQMLLKFSTYDLMNSSLKVTLNMLNTWNSHQLLIFVLFLFCKPVFGIWFIRVQVHVVMPITGSSECTSYYNMDDWIDISHVTGGLLSRMMSVCSVVSLSMIHELCILPG